VTVSFSNRVEDAEPPSRERVERARAELDRILALPAGDPELLRYFEGGRAVVPVEFAAAIDEAERALGVQET
jgi:hypothetical protein